MKKEKTLREHLSEIAIKRQKDLKEKLGKEGYSEFMRKISNARKGKDLTK